MASTTKIMTALLTLEQTDLDTYFEVDAEAVSYTHLHLLDVRHVRNPRKRAALFFRRNLFLVVNLDREPGVSQAAFSRLAETIGKRFSIERMVGGVLMHLMQGSTEVLAS